MKTKHLILYGKIFAVCSAVHTKHINYSPWEDGRICDG